MAFTTIERTTSWQSLDIANELADAYNARVAALTATERSHLTYSSITPAEGQTVTAFIHKMQIGCEELAAQGWADPSASVAGGTDYIQALTPAALFHRAGLTTAGYWRAIGTSAAIPSTWDSYSDPAFSFRRIGEAYGYYLPGASPDKAGPWLWLDLQMILSQMTRRVYLPSSVSSCNTGMCSGNPTPLSPATPSYTCNSGDSGVLKNASKNVNESNVTTRQTAEDSYRDITLSGLPSTVKTVRLLVKSEWPTSYGSAYSVFHAFGNPISLPSFGSTLVSVAGSDDSTTSTSVTLRDVSSITAWSDLLSLVPSVYNSPYNGWTYFLKLTAGSRFVVDFTF